MASGRHAVVDIGSNGIRCSISDLTQSTTNHPRLLPTLFADRFAISLHDAQHPEGSHERHALSDTTIATVVSVFRGFKQTCNDFEVPERNVTVVATEATRTALNATQFLVAIKQELEWDVQLLSKEDEATAGALGIATSVPEVKGLVMDLGGGSVQLTSVDTFRDDWHQSLHQNAVSLPLGAAALLKQVNTAESSNDEARLEEELSLSLRQALDKLGFSRSTEKLNLYVSGGGFRGWGYLFMARISPYPIPWVNGFQISARSFYDVDGLMTFTDQSASSDDGKGHFFRVSKRRLKQLPATCLLVKCLAAVLPNVDSVTFCQGGTQAGTLFARLPNHMKSTLRFGDAMSHAIAPDGSQSLCLDPLAEAIPAGHQSVDRRIMALLPAFAHSLYIHASLVKDIRTTTALRFPITDVIGSAIGITHYERAALSLMLVERWGGRTFLPSTDQATYDQLTAILKDSMGVWWCRYIGRIGALLGTVWPAGLSDSSSEATHNRAIVKSCCEKDGKLTLIMQMQNISDAVREAIEDVEKLGKKKNWVGGCGLKVVVEVQEGDS